MSISSYLSELDSINKENQRIKKQLQSLKIKKDEVQEKIQKWFIKNNQTSITYNGKVVSLENTTTKKRKKKSEKIENFDNVLRKYGHHNTNKIIKELLEANSGNNVETTKLNFKKK